MPSGTPRTRRPEDPTPRQREALRFIYHHVAEVGRPPTLRTLDALLFGEGHAFTGEAVSGVLRRLERKGLVERRRGAACAVRLVGLLGFALPGPRGLPVFENSPAGVRLMRELFGEGR